jgi:G:T-mismatch repair DNA endonuclease (very short patch repair protein)
MASIVRENTKPELAVRRILWQLGARYRLHAKNLQAGCSHAGAAQNRLGAWVFLALA